jgi:hypothetical protein
VGKIMNSQEKSHEKILISVFQPKDLPDLGFIIAKPLWNQTTEVYAFKARDRQGYRGDDGV